MSLQLRDDGGWLRENLLSRDPRDAQLAALVLLWIGAGFLDWIGVSITNGLAQSLMFATFVPVAAIWSQRALPRVTPLSEDEAKVPAAIIGPLNAVIAGLAVGERIHLLLVVGFVFTVSAEHVRKSASPEDPSNLGQYLVDIFLVAMNAFLLGTFVLLPAFALGSSMLSFWPLALGHTLYASTIVPPVLAAVWRTYQHYSG